MSEVMNVPEGWEVKNFSELAKVNMGQSPDSLYVNENQDGMAFLQGNADFGEINPKELYWVTEPKKVAKKGDILISVRAPVGDMNIADKEYCIGRGLATLTVNKINSSYGFYILFQEKRQLDRLSQGSTFLAIGKNDFDVIEIKYPIDTKEQQKIAKILSTIDQAIEATQKLIVKEKNIKKGLMHDLFSNGIDENGKIRTLKTHKYKESELGLIPEEWRVEKVGKHIHLMGGFAFKSQDSVEHGIRWLKIANVGITRIKWEHISYLPKEYYVRYENFVLRENDIVLAMTRPILGMNLKIAKMSIEDVPSLLNQRVGKFIFDQFVDSSFMYQLFQYIDFVNILMLKIIGTDPPNVGSEDIEDILILFPEPEEQTRIAKILTTQDKKIETEEKNLEKLKELKKGLMDDLLSGKVRVKV